MALTIPSDYDEAVTVLARAHAAGLDQPIDVYSVPDPAGEVVQLIEVSGAFPASGDYHIFRFGRSAEYPFRSAVLQITPEEWGALLASPSQLPAGWDLSCRRKVLP